jgi:glycerophosphoryl diester phosphodiesterase
MPAILHALDLGAQGIEIDVHATADGILVVHHDAEISDGRALASLSRREAAAVEIGPGIRIPLLDDVLDAVRGRAFLFIETKVEGLEFPLMQAVRRSAAESAIHSFHHSTIRNLKLTMPAIRAGILTSGDAVGALRAAADTRADDIWHQASDIEASLPSDAHRLGKQVIAWTVNSKSECRRLESLDVDGICTDDLSLLSAVAR